MGDDLELHSAFVNSMLTQTLSEVFVDVSDMNARLEVYRRNFMQGHCNALRKTYAMTALYLGEKFEAFAVSYVCQHRPETGPLFATYGKSFSSFLLDPFLADLARLEWILQTVVMAAVEEHQSTVNSDQAYWRLRSDVRLLQSNYNVGDVYRTLKIAGEIGHIDQGCYYYVVWSKDGVPILQPLSLEEYRVLDMLRSPQQIDELFDKLTFPKEIIVNILPKVFNQNFLKVSNDNSIDHSEMC